MSNVKEYMTTIQNCNDCYGRGYTGWVSPDGDFDFDWCDCNPLGISTGEEY